MATTSPSTTTTNTGFAPFFKRAAQGEDRHADVYACIATLSGQTTADIQRLAEDRMGVPKTGPYAGYIDETLIAKLLATYGLVSTVWKECKGWSEVPDVAIAMCEYNTEWEIGRCVVFHRQKQDKTIQPYIVDPYPHTDTKQHLRVGTTEIATLVPCWYIGVHPAKEINK